MNGPVARLVGAWCERRALAPLATLLPSYVSNNGLTDGWGELLNALYTLRGSRGLPSDEHAEIERLVVLVEQMVCRTELLIGMLLS